MATVEDILMVLLAIVFAPLAVYFADGCGPNLCINVLLCLLAYIPGVLHAFYVLATTAPQQDRRID